MIPDWRTPGVLRGNVEVAHRFANAAMQAALMCGGGGTKAVSPAGSPF